jgi:hypothetical protein
MNLRNELVKRAPDLLFGSGVLGFVVAVVMSAKATPKAMDILEEQHFDAVAKRPSKTPTRLEKTRAVAPVYIPTAGVVLLSIGMLLASDRIVRNRYASLLAIYSIAERTLRDWEKSTAENVTPKKLNTIKERVLGPSSEVPSEEDFVDGNRLFWDAFSARFFYAQSVDTVRRAFSEINLDMVHDNFVALNSLYEALNMDPIEYGYDAGWNIDDGEVHPIFDSVMRNDRAYIRVQYPVKPRSW